MTRALPLVLLLSACGPAASGGGVDMQLFVQAGLLDVISGFQVALVKSGSTLDCVAAQKTCIKGQVDATRFVPVKDSKGAQKKALFFPINLVAGTPNTQDVSLDGLSPGKDFAVIVEAVSKDTPARLTGSSCNYVQQISVGQNAAVSAHIETFPTPVTCDVRIDP